MKQKGVKKKGGKRVRRKMKKKRHRWAALPLRPASENHKWGGGKKRRSKAISPPLKET